MRGAIDVPLPARRYGPSPLSVLSILTSSTITVLSDFKQSGMMSPEITQSNADWRQGRHFGDRCRNTGVPGLAVGPLVHVFEGCSPNIVVRTSRRFGIAIAKRVARSVQLETPR